MKIAACLLLLLTVFPPAPSAAAEVVPQAAVAPLSFLIGEWELAGRMEPDTVITGHVVYEWLPGGYFLVQRGDLHFGSLLLQGLEIVGWDESQKAFVSHGYGNLDSEVGSYRWDFSGDTLVITSGEMRFEGKLSEDRKVLAGGWRWKEDGVEKIYTVTATRVR